MIHDENSKPNKAANATNKIKGGKTIEETYTKKTQLEHILLRPDTYVGSVEKQAQQMWVFDRASGEMENKIINFVPGLYKIFDEIIVNAADNKQRDPSMNRLEVNINEEENSIRVWNNGNGVPVHIHAEHKIYVPELVFANLLTGSNFNDQEEKTTGGRNGYGAKLTNIFSKRFIIETLDSSRGLKYRQEFSNNMSTRSDPVITTVSKAADYTAITFYPDLERFKMDSLDEDIVSLLCKRVYDIAGTNSASGSKLSVYLNGNKIEAKNFEQYIGLYRGLETPVAFERISDRWEIGVGVSDGTFQQVSFVNSISTTKGGCHVAYITDQITAKLMGVVKKKNKNEEVKAGQIKNHLSVYVNCLIVNPAFDSQTKETLTTKPSAFGSTCTVPDKMMKLIEKSGIIENILSWAKFKQTNDLKKKSGTKRSKIIGITKLDDANCAGTSKSADCTLILTEGDSAKALAISGLGVVGRDYYGVFPLKGKLLNVREAAHAQMMKNEEIQNIVRILGLTFGKTYDDASSLRYGHLMIMADQDHDGSHIKGLLINFLHHFWPSLLKIKGFLQQFITPIVKCMRGKKEVTFFTIPEYQNWREANEDGRGWKIKYYKGLGTSTSAEAKEYFSNLLTHEINFKWDERADDMIDMAFAKKRVEDRKLWLLSMEPGQFIDYTVDSVSYDDFINHELILFSHADNERSIPHYMDGLKPSQRKVLFSCFKRNLKNEIKVAQLAGYISEHSAYHHGEVSLTQTIIGMAQNFVGSNNINLLSPCGQFGTRLMGGKDAASPRYVFTKLQNITRCIYHPHDDPLLEYLDDDGQSIEPSYYVPIIPMALVNGSEGIGTGWSSSIPTYNPREIIEILRQKLNGNDEVNVNLAPWFRGFIGAVERKTGKDFNNFVVSGIIEVVDEGTVTISELPVGKWTTDYKQFLESVLIGGNGQSAKEKEDGPAPIVPFVKDFKENHTDTTVLFTVTVAPEKLVEFQNEKGGLAKKFKLDGSVATSNMHMFDLSSQIQKFEGPGEVLEEFYKIRLMYYDKRKQHLHGKLTEEWDRLDNKMRFILAVISGKIVVSNRKKLDIMHDLRTQGFQAFDEKKVVKEIGEPGTPVEEVEELSGPEKGYDYLLSMKIWSLTLEKVAELKAQKDSKRAELERLDATAAETLWLADLDNLEVALEEFEEDIEAEKRQETAARKKAKSDKANKNKGGKGASRAKGKGRGDSDDEEEEDNDSDFEEKERIKKEKSAAAKKKAAAAVAAKAPVAVVAKAPTVAMVTKPVAATASTKPINEHFKPTATVVPPAIVTKPSAAAVASKPKITMSSKPMDVETIDRETMSLSDRLKAASLVNKEKLEVQKNLLTASVAAKAVAASKPKTKPAAKVSPSTVHESDDEDVTPTLAVTRAPRAVAKKSYALDSDGEEEDVDTFHSEDDESESGSDSEVEVIKKKPAAKKAAPAAKAVVTKPAAKVVPALITTPIKKAAGVKRAAKSGVVDAVQKVVMDLYSPGGESPKAIKKAKVVSKPAAPKVVKPVAAKPVAAKKAAAPAAKSKKGVVHSDDDEEFDSQDDSASLSRLVSRSPKPVRARKPTSFKAMYAEDESEEDDFVVEDSDDSEVGSDFE